MKKSLCVLLCFAVVLISCAVGFSAFAGTDSLSLAISPSKLYYLTNSDEVDVSGGKLVAKVDGETKTIEFKENIKRAGSLADAASATPSGSVTAKPSNVKLYYNYPLADGKNEVILMLGDKSVSYNVFVDQNPVKSIQIIKEPTKKSYFYGHDNDKDVDLSGLEIKVNFNKCGGDAEKSYTYKYDEVKSVYFMGHRFNIKFAYQIKIGDNQLIVSYLGKEAQFSLKYLEVITGDVNDDGKVNAADLVRLSRIVINDENLPYNALTTDIETDGKINQKDLKALRKMLTMPDMTGEYEWVFDAELLSYKYHEDGFFYTAGDPWQRNFGFNALYDYAAPYTCMYYDTFRIYFEYGTYEDGSPKEWMLQGWKGQYGMVLYGAELGVYTKSPERVTPHYDCAADEDLLGMEMSVYKDEELAFTHPYKMHWWTTGFKPGALDNYTDLTKPHSQLTVKFTVDFPSIEMANLFADGLDKKGFEKVGFIDTVNFRKVDTYTVDENRVVFLWRNIVDSPNGTNM